MAIPSRNCVCLTIPVPGKNEEDGWKMHADAGVGQGSGPICSDWAKNVKYCNYRAQAASPSSGLRSLSFFWTSWSLHFHTWLQELQVSQANWESEFFLKTWRYWTTIPLYIVASVPASSSFEIVWGLFTIACWDSLVAVEQSCYPLWWSGKIPWIPCSILFAWLPCCGCCGCRWVPGSLA